MSFSDREVAKKFYAAYAQKVGFGVSFGNSKPYSQIIKCTNNGAGSYYKKDEAKRVRNNTSKRTKCMARIKLQKIYGENGKEPSVVIEQVNLVHNHPFLKKDSETINMTSHKEKDPVFLGFVDDLQAADVSHQSINTLVRDMHGGVENVPITMRDLENRKAANLREEHANDVGKLLEFFEDCKAQNPQFHWYVKLDKEGVIHSLIWSHASMQAEYIDFGEVMSFDTTHKTNI